MVWFGLLNYTHMGIYSRFWPGEVLEGTAPCMTMRYYIRAVGLQQYSLVVVWYGIVFPLPQTCQ
jgi:hypothetical protein